MRLCEFRSASREAGIIPAERIQTGALNSRIGRRFAPGCTNLQECAQTADWIANSELNRILMNARNAHERKIMRIRIDSHAFIAT